MHPAVRGWFFILFWAYWVGYFIIRKGIDEGWADEHPGWWWTFVIAALFFYGCFQEYLDFNLPGPEPTPCLMVTFLIGILVGRYDIPKGRQ